MNILFVDFETYFDGNFSLKDAKSSAEYVMTTEVQLMGWAVGRDPVNMAVGEEQIKSVLSSIDWPNTILVSHNIRFDGRLIHQRFGYNPAMYIDTMAMMASLRYDVIFGGLKLRHLSKVLQGEGLSIEDKGEELKEVKGKHLFRFASGHYYLYDHIIDKEYLERINITKSGKKRTGKAVKDPRQVVGMAINLFERFKEYCSNDVEICRQGFYFMIGKIPKSEISYQDMIARCALYPQLMMDVTLLKSAKHKAETALHTAVKEVADDWFYGDYSQAKDSLLSTSKLAIVLKAMGGMTQDEIDDYISSEGFDPEPPFVIPTKVSEAKSLTAGRPVYEYALAKKDAGMVQLMQVEYEPLQKVLAARKTAVYANNYELPRLNRFINEQEAYGSVGMPLKVSGASTHRLGGDLFNIQNLSSGRNEGQDATMRKSIMALPGNVVVAADSSAVEARVLSFIANCKSQLDVFYVNGDLYCEMAGAIYNEDPKYIKAQHKDGNKDYTFKRQIGKFTILGSGYGMGGAGFRDQLSAQSNIELTVDEATKLINTYRDKYTDITGFWNVCNNVLRDMASGGKGYFGGSNGKLFYYDGTIKIAGKRVPSILLPDGLWLRYCELQLRERKYQDGSSKNAYCYYGIDKGKPAWIWTYGARITENLCQALAFAIMKWQACNINKVYPIAFNVHDEWVVTALENEAEQANKFLIDRMSEVPPWAAGCPITAESNYAVRYGDT